MFYDIVMSAKLVFYVMMILGTCMNMGIDHLIASAKVRQSEGDPLERCVSVKHWRRGTGGWIFRLHALQSYFSFGNSWLGIFLVASVSIDRLAAARSNCRLFGLAAQSP